MEPVDIERKCITDHPRCRRMSLRPGEGWALHGLIRVLRPQTVVEIGRLAGVSSSWILTALEANHSAWRIPKSPEDGTKAQEWEWVCGRCGYTIVRDRRLPDGWSHCADSLRAMCPACVAALPAEQQSKENPTIFKMGHLHSIDIHTKPEAVTKLAPWVEKKMVTMHEFSSHGPESEALAEKLGTVDFLFIDGNHSSDPVEADCRLWLPRVRGYVLFHDWDWESVRVGIQRVVDLDKFPHIMTKEHMDPAQIHGRSHGLMLLYLPEGLERMPAEPPGRLD